MIIGGSLGYHLLRAIKTIEERPGQAPYVADYPRILADIAGEEAWRSMLDRTILDFGCGSGEGVVQLAREGARRVIGVDIRPSVLEEARRHAEEAGVADRCLFVERVDEPVDVIISVDAFEHFGDPAAILRIMSSLLRDDGRVLVSFGPTWYHPLGGHLFSVFPWSHLVFTEKSLIRWRADFRGDGATRFSEVEGGLNQMTIGRFEKLVAESDFRFERLRTVPIRPLRSIHGRLTREFTTAVVRCVLVKKGPAAARPAG